MSLFRSVVKSASLFSARLSSLNFRCSSLSLHACSIIIFSLSSFSIVCRHSCSKSSRSWARFSIDSFHCISILFCCWMKFPSISRIPARTQSLLFTFLGDCIECLSNCPVFCLFPLPDFLFGATVPFPARSTSFSSSSSGSSEYSSYGWSPEAFSSLFLPLIEPISGSSWVWCSLLSLAVNSAWSS